MGTNLYEEIGLSTDVMTASPHKLIDLLLEKAISEINSGINAIETSDTATKLVSISKAIDVVSYLRVCLKAEDEETLKLAERLAVVYDRAEQDLIKGNLNNDIGLIKEAKVLLETIHESWSQIRAKVEA